MRGGPGGEDRAAVPVTGAAARTTSEPAATTTSATSWEATSAVSAEGGSGWTWFVPVSPTTGSHKLASEQAQFDVTGFLIYDQEHQRPVGIALPDHLVLHVTCPA